MSDSFMPDSFTKDALVSVLIATRDRPEDLLLCLQSIFRLDYANYEVLIVDQSTSDLSEQRVGEAFGAQASLHYLRSDVVGKSNALNLLMQHARGDIFAFTDDDTVVPSDWLKHIIRAFESELKPDIVFGQVHPNPDINANAETYIPSYEFQELRQLERGDISGMGANMAMRREAAEKVGHYDSLLGPGAPMSAAEEGDFVYRAHQYRLRIVQDPSIQLVHRACRDRKQWHRVMYNYGMGDGAFALKHLRCGDIRIALLLVHKPMKLFARMCSRLIRRQESSEKDYLRGYFTGLAASLKYRVDRRRRLYVSS